MCRAVVMALLVCLWRMSCRLGVPGIVWKAGGLASFTYISVSPDLFRKTKVGLRRHFQARMERFSQLTGRVYFIGEKKLRARSLCDIIGQNQGCRC